MSADNDSLDTALSKLPSEHPLSPSQALDAEIRARAAAIFAAGPQPILVGPLWPGLAFTTAAAYLLWAMSVAASLY